MVRGRGTATPQDVETMKIISVNLKKLLEENNLKQNQLAELLEIPKSSFNEYVTGKRLPKSGNVQKIADYFGLKKSDIDPRFKANNSAIINRIVSTASKLAEKRQAKVLTFATNQLKEQRNENTSIVEIAEAVSTYNEKVVDFQKVKEGRDRVTGIVEGALSAGTGIMQDDNMSMEVTFYKDEIPEPDEYQTIAIVVGHSMEPKIMNGDYLFIETTSQVELNEIGIFQVDGENYVKKLRNGYLESMNPDYPNIPLSRHNDIRTIGRIVEIYREN